jgi:hypothetical protein
MSQVERGAPERIRTSDTRFRKPLLYPLSYEGGTYDHASEKRVTDRVRTVQSLRLHSGEICQGRWTARAPANVSGKEGDCAWP